MLCNKCNSGTYETFNGELAIHFPGPDGLEKPIVLLCPELAVCLQCGHTEFAVLDRELCVLREGAEVEGTCVLWPAPDAAFEIRADKLPPSKNGFDCVD